MRYERLPDFIELAAGFDGGGKFRNRFTRRYLFAEGA